MTYAQGRDSKAVRFTEPARMNSLNHYQSAAYAQDQPLELGGYFAIRCADVHLAPSGSPLLDWAPPHAPRRARLRSSAGVDSPASSVAARLVAPSSGRPPIGCPDR